MDIIEIKVNKHHAAIPKADLISLVVPSSQRTGFVFVTRASCFALFQFGRFFVVTQ